MKIISDFNRLKNENYHSYIWRLDGLIQSGKYKNWKEITPMVNKELFGDDEESYRDESAYRKGAAYARQFYEAGVFGNNKDDYLKELDAQKRELERAKIQFRDERNAWNKQNYVDARVEQKLDYLEEQLANQGRVLFEQHNSPIINSDNDLLIQVSDLHIGQTFKSYFGEYNTDIAKVRMNKYLNEILKIQKRHNSKNAIVILQGDIISGGIHKSIQISNRENVIEQIKCAIEIISSFCYELTENFENVYLYNISGNHSRLDKKEDAVHDERLDDLIGWDVGRTLSHIDNFHLMTHRNIDSGIADIIIRNKSYIAIHGDFDAYSKSGVSDLCMILGFKPEAVLYGHLHHCSYDEQQGVKLIRSGSLPGCGDDYTIEKRLIGRPSQMVSVCSDSGVECCYPIGL